MMTPADARDDEGVSAMQRRRTSWGTVAWIAFACATVFGLLETSKAYVASRLEGAPLSWTEQFVRNMPWWYIWAILAPLVVVLARRVPFVSRDRVLKPLTKHLGAAILLNSLHICVTSVIYVFTAHMSVLPAKDWGSVRKLILMWHGSMFMSNVMTYAAIVVIVHAVEYFRDYASTRIASLQLEAKAAQLEHGIIEARLNALQKELNPYFLFNALNAIAGLIRQQANDRAILMLARLGDLLRVILDRHLATEIPLRDELALLDHYLEIERVRMGDRLAVRMTVPDSLQNAMVPTLCLQPLVENAVRHGLAAQTGTGTVTVSACTEDGALYLQVDDTGAGVPAGHPIGFGIGNTRARLEQLYGRGAGIELVEAPGGGARTRVWLPLHYEGDDTIIAAELIGATVLV